MSHFYGKISNSARKTIPTARGHKNTGLDVEACSWEGKITTITRHVDGVDKFEVWMMPHEGAGDCFMLVSGDIGDKNSVEFDPLAVFKDTSTDDLLKAVNGMI